MSEQSGEPALRFGWTILHVPDVRAALELYERAFGMQRRFLDPAGDYGELDTGATVLAFAAHRLIERIGAHTGGAHFPNGFEIALIADPSKIDAAFERAVAAGCAPVKPLATTPWGQIVGFVRDPDGVLVEICTPAPPP